MMLHPFPLLHAYRDKLTVAWWVKQDDLTTDRAGKQIGAKAIAHANQVHGGLAMRVNGGITDPLPEVDALTTDRAGLLLLSKSADCQSMIFYDPVHHATAVVHAGWKGLLANVIPNTIVLMEREWRSDASKLIVAAAPSLGVCCAEFSDPVRELPNIDHAFFHGHNVDLQGIADAQLLECGITKDRIDRMTLCTKCNSDLLWSYRADPESIKNGHRNLLGVMLK